MKITKSVFVLIILAFCSVSHSEMKTVLRVDNLSFISADYETTDKKNYTFMGATLLSDPKKPELFMLNLTGVYALGNSLLSYLEIREIYFTFKIDYESSLHLGRKLYNWSSLDSDWNLGFYQPQFRWSPLSPENQGLTGLLWEKNISIWGLSLFASPVFVPDQGPGYELKEGRFQSSNPWFPNPPKNVSIQGQLFPLNYEIHKPETSDVVFQQVYAAQIRVGDRNGFFTNIAGAYKPSHQLALGYKATHVITDVRIDVVPKTYYENIFSADLGYREEWGLVQVAALLTKPQTPTFDAGYNSPVFTDSLSWGPKLVYRYRPFTFSLSYLDTTGGEVKQTGPDVTNFSVSPTQRFLFRQAIQYQVGYRDIYFKKMLIDSTVQLRQSTKDEFTELRIKNKILTKSPWSFWADIILIETAEQTTSNMGSYRNVDQMWIGAGYDI